MSAEKGWLTETGVTLENIGAICREFGLDVESTSEGCLEELASAIEEGCQIIVAVDGGELTGNQIEEEIEDAFYGQISDHCVIVLAVEDDTVTLYDPAFGSMPLPVSHSHFMDAWADSGKYFVTVSKK